VTAGLDGKYGHESKPPGFVERVLTSATRTQR
jgi:hypothetical protein